jgi:hypothetical protein
MLGLAQAEEKGSGFGEPRQVIVNKNKIDFPVLFNYKIT